MSAVTRSESDLDPSDLDPSDTAMSSLLSSSVDAARAAAEEMHEGVVGAHIGVEAASDSAVVHRFDADISGYRGWQWAVVLAAPPHADTVTVSEVALLPGPDALVAPTWVPWDQRVRPGDLGAGDLLPPPVDDPRLVPGYVATGDPEVDDVALELGFGRLRLLSLEGRLDAAERWAEGDFGPDSPMAKSAPSTCGLCGFYLPIAGSLKAAFGVCGNEMAADGRVVHTRYGCGAHSDTAGPTGAGSPAFDAYDDGALDTVANSVEKRVDPVAGQQQSAGDSETPETSSPQ